MSPKETLLYLITELMFEKQQNFLLLDELYEDEVISPFVRNIQIDSPYQQLVFDGVLSQYNHQNEIVVSFTIEAYFHHLLAKFLQKDERYQSAESLLELIKNNKLEGIKEGVSNLFSFDIEVGNFKHVKELIDLSEGDEVVLELNVVPLVNSLIINGIEKTLNLLVNRPTENYWKNFLQIDKRLEDLELHLVRELFLINLIKFNLTSSKFEILIALKSIFVLDEKTTIRYKNKLKYLDISQLEDADLLFFWGEIEMKLGNYEFSLLLFEKTLEIKSKKIKSLSQLSVIIIFQNIGYLYSRIGNTDKAFEICSNSLDYLLNKYGENNIWVSNIYSNISFNYFSIGEFDKAIENSIKNLNLSEKLFGKNHSILATSNKSLGMILDNLNDNYKAIFYYKKCLEIELKIYGEYHSDVAQTYYLIGTNYFILSNYQNAILFFIKCLKICEKKSNFSINELANLYHSLGVCHFNVNDIFNSIEFFKKGFEISKKGAFPFQIAQSYEGLNNPLEALDYYIQSAEIRKEDPEVGLQSESTIESINNAKRLAKQLNKQNELPQWIKNIN